MTTYAWLAALLVLVASITGVYMKGRVDGKEVVRAEWQAADNARKVAEDRAIAERLRANELRVKKEAANVAKIRKGFEHELAQARAAHANAGSLRIPAAVCAGFAGSAESKSAGSRDADATGTVALPEATQRDLQDLMRQADEVVATCRALQEWVKSQDLAP